MVKKEITLYELIGLMKDEQPPKRIIYDDTYWDYDKNDNDYFSTSRDILLFDEYLKNGFFDYLNDTVEIVSKDNGEWADIEDVTLNGEIVRYGILKEWLDFTPSDNEQKICSCIETLGITMNQLIKNQKYLKERLDKDE